MGLGLLVPAFLIGLAAIAIPVIVHLLNKERKEIVRFPSLMFLERIPYRAIRRQTIRHPLLLALRALAILLLVAAFARPFLERSNDLATALPGGRELVILLDRSYSMGYGDRWARAVQAVRNEAQSAQGGDRLTLIGFDDKATVLSGPASDAATISAALDSLRPGDRTTRLGPALAAAREVLAGSSLTRREVVLISDLQRGAWDGRSDARLPANVSSRVISLADTTAGNALVAGIEIDREVRNGQSMGSVVAQLRNQAAQAVAREVTLEVQGRAVETKTVELRALGTATVRFAQVAIPPSPIQAQVRLGGDALLADDVLHFSLSRDQSLPVLVLAARPGAGRSIYVQRALGLGRTPPVDLRVRAPAALTRDDVDRAAVVVLNNVAFPSGPAGARLIERVKSGIGLIVIAGDGSDPARWSAEARGLLPAVTGAMVDRTGDLGGRLANLERSHRVFQPFAGPRSGDFTAARFLRYRTLEPKDSASALAWFDDGNVALVEGSAGRGRVLVWGTTMDDYWNDLVLQPVFLPFLLTSVQYSAGYTPEPLWRTLGQQLALQAGVDSSAAGTGDQGTVVVTPRGGRSRLETGARTFELAEPGFYQVQAGDDGERARLVAVNVDRAESDFRAWNPDELLASVASTDTLPLNAAAESLTDTQREKGQRVWWFLLLAAALILLTEIVVANRMSRAAI